MRIAVIGAGPAGLYFSGLVKQIDKSAEVVVWERNAPDDTFGFGVVFSDQTLSGIKASDRPTFDEMGEAFAYWDDIDVWRDGESMTIGGNGFAAMSRKELLRVLQRGALARDVDIRFRTEAPDVEELIAQYDLVVACDGINSPIRERYAADFGASVDPRHAKYMWLGTDTVYDAFKFFVKRTEWGVIQVHAYPINDSLSTFIVEMHEDVWRRGGFDAVDAATLPPGVSDQDSIDRLAEIFADVLQGGSLVANNSKWISFRTIRNDTVVRGNLVLLGDAAHTAHFSIGSGTKLAMEDSLALAACLMEQPDLASALAAYDAERNPVAKSLQRAAQASMEWFEEIHQYADQDLAQFVFNMTTRSRRVTYGNLQERDPAFVAKVDEWLLADQVRRGRVPEGTASVPPIFLPFRVRGIELANRIVVAPIGLYSAGEDGVPTDLHLAHYGARALGGAGLILTEMVATSPQARITPGDPGLWDDEQERAWTRIVDLVHTTPAKIGVQLGHAGAKGSVAPPWTGSYVALTDGGWPTMSASAVAYGPGVPAPRAMTRADMDAVVAETVAATERAARAGFDAVELQFAHGFLVASFLSPLTNQRDDEYGGTTSNRLRFPLELLDAVRAAWPADRPLSVRISACDWADGGLSAEDSVTVAAALTEHGADLIDVSTGETLAASRPEYGRSYQTPFSDRIRNLTGAATIAVGSISSWDDANTIVAAGRADLVAIGRPSLYDPAWPLHAAAEQGVTASWPEPYRVGSSVPPAGRAEDLRPRLSLTSTEAVVDRPSRWRPNG